MRAIFVQATTLFSAFPLFRHKNFVHAGLIYTTVISGLKVRSKAESQIVGKFVQLELPFRYEEMLIINGIAIHPDFSCLYEKKQIADIGIHR